MHVSIININQYVYVCWLNIGKGGGGGINETITSA